MLENKRQCFCHSFLLMSQSRWFDAISWDIDSLARALLNTNFNEEDRNRGGARCAHFSGFGGGVNFGTAILPVPQAVTG
jgi:hypothetical protein